MTFESICRKIEEQDKELERKQVSGVLLKSLIVFLTAGGALFYMCINLYDIMALKVAICILFPLLYIFLLSYMSEDIEAFHGIYRVMKLWWLIEIALVGAVVAAKFLMNM
jgi:hypothetical protein